MTKRKVIRKSNRPFTYNPNYYSWGGDLLKALNLKDTFNFKNTFSGSNVGNMLKGGISGAAGSAVGNVVGDAIGGGLKSGAGSAISNIGGAAGSIIGTVNPLLGGIVSAGSGILGGVTNALFGSKLNQEKINEIEGSNKGMNTLMVDNSSADSVMNQWANQDFGSSFSKSDIGKDGLFSNKAKNKYNELLKQQDIARNRALTAFKNAADAADMATDLNAATNFAAYGGPLSKITSLPNSFTDTNTFASGGKIHIKKANRGKFTKYCGGKVTSECIAKGKRSSDPAVRKRATFAANARKWHHAYGGPLTDEQYYDIMEKVAEENYKNWGYNNPDEALADALNNNTYNYRGYYNKYPNSNANALTHWTDEFKTVYHPTFSDESIYSGKKSQYNPQGLVGGHWDEETFIPANWQRKNKKKAFGGDLLTHGAEWNNGVTVIGNGGTHENNPYEGVQMGMDNQGIPNLVEEGEVVFNDYVFSNRLTVPDAVRAKYKLRGNKELTFADAAKQMQKESEERPNDPISKRGLLSSMSRLQQAQETVREEKQASQEGVQYAYGGRMGTLFNGLGEKSNLMARAKGKRLGYDVGNSLEDYFEDPVYENGDTNKGFDLTQLRYAPVVGAAIGLGQNLFSKPDYSSADAILEAANQAGNYTPIGYTPIGNYLQYRPFDRNFYLNKLNAQAGATRRAIMNTTSPSRNAALLAADYNALSQLGDLARKAEEYNSAQRQAIELFNRGTNLANAEMGLKAAMANQEALLKSRSGRLSGITLAMNMRNDIDARRAASYSANLTNLFDSLGNIGIDAYNRADRDRLIRAGVFGTLNEKPQEWSLKRWEDYKKALNGIGYKNGGKLNRRKKGGFTY